MDADNGDTEAGAAEEPVTEGGETANADTAKKTTRKTAAKATKKAAPRKRATKAAAASAEASEDAQAKDTAGGKEPAAKKTARKSAGQTKDRASEAAAASDDIADAPLFAAETVDTPVEAQPSVSQALPEAEAHSRNVEEPAGEGDDGADEMSAGEDLHAGEDVHSGEDDQAGEEDQAAEESHEGDSGDRQGSPLAGDGHQRLSRRDRRRLRMIEKRDERRRERSDRPAADAAPQAGEQGTGDGEVAATETTPVISARREREPGIGRDARHDRDSRSGGSNRGDRGGRNDRDGRTERNGKSDSDSRSDRFRGKNSQSTTLISEVLKEGQEVVVQIAKEPLGQKGARITSHIALPGRYVVYMPTVEHVGVSRKVGTDQERLRLRKILQSGREGMPGGFICRTAAEGRSEADIHADMQFLNTLWQEIKAKADKKNPPALIHHDLDIVQRVLRDQLTEEFKTIWVDNEDLYERILRFVQSFQPSLVSRVRLYTKPAPIFDTFNVTTELEKALKPKVWLKSGGYIVINQTEALVAIDVNTGKFVGKSNRLEDTIVKTNLEAVKEAVRQIRLRDLGGIIVVDFIDMDERRNRQKVMQALDEEMKEDRAPYKILQFNDFGLVAITRKRVKQSLERTLCQPCPYCEGSGYIKNVQTVIGEILTEAQKIASAVEGEVSLRVNPEVGKVLKSHTNNYLEELEEILKVPVIVTSDPLLHQEKFDLA
ncbi:MAG: Rne/Rng family ribonuclease [Bryobacterales bacterium]|nr:Rne/Rng family ribonuclease [Bryobacterales bacterium]